MTTLAIDLVIIAIVAFCGWRGYKNGLIRGVFGVVALVVSIFVANIAAEAYSEEFTGMLKPFVGGLVDSALVDLIDEGIEYDPDEHEHENESGEFGDAYNALRWIGLPEPSAVRIAEMAVDQDDEEQSPGRTLSDLIAENLSSVLAYVAVFAVAFILLAIIFAVIGNLIGFVFSLPGLKYLDIIAGVLFGLAKGLILVYVLAAVVRYFGLLAIDILEETSVLNHLVNNNPIADTLGI